MSNSQPSHLVSPDGIRVPVSGAVEAVNLRSRGYRDLTPKEVAQLDVERAGLALEQAKKAPGSSSDAAKNAQQEYQLAVQRAERFLADAAADLDDAPASDEEVPARPSRPAKPAK